MLFGRLQMFTGVEFFGIIFFLFSTAAVVWSLRPGKTVLDKVLLAAAAVTVVVVVSGVRKLSWSNPRFISSVLPIAAYFAAPLMVSIEDSLKRRVSWARTKSLVPWTLVLVLLVPTALATSIRGAKVEITNPGTFYRDFRSLAWLDYAVEDPIGAAGRLWNEYLGIRKTVRYLWADDETKLKHAHDYFAAVLYIKEATPADAKVLVFRDARFFYYGQRRGVVWYSPEIDGGRPLQRARSAEEAADYLCSEGFTHVLVDSYSEQLIGYKLTRIRRLLADVDLALPVYEFGTARVYALSCGRT